MNKTVKRFQLSLVYLYLLYKYLSFNSGTTITGIVIDCPSLTDQSSLPHQSLEVGQLRTSISYFYTKFDQLFVHLNIGCDFTFCAADVCL